MDNLVRSIEYLHLNNIEVVDNHDEKTITVNFNDIQGYLLTTVVINKMDEGFTMYRWYKLGHPGIFDGLKNERDVLEKLKKIHSIVYGNK